MFRTRNKSLARCLLNRAAVGWAVSCSAFGFIFYRAAVGVHGHVLPSVYLTALPKAGAVLELPSVFYRAAVGVRGHVLPSVYYFFF